MNKGKPINEAEETRRGQMLADVLDLPHSTEPGRYRTEWGSKTALGLYRTVKRIIEEGE